MQLILQLICSCQRKTSINRRSCFVKMSRTIIAVYQPEKGKTRDSERGRHLTYVTCRVPYLCTVSNGSDLVGHLFHSSSFLLCSQGKVPVQSHSPTLSLRQKGPPSNVIIFNDSVHFVAISLKCRSDVRMLKRQTLSKMFCPTRLFFFFFSKCLLTFYRIWKKSFVSDGYLGQLSKSTGVCHSSPTA